MNIETANVLSTLLLKSGYVEASHICHLLFGTGTFGLPTDVKPSFELLGSDRSLPNGFGRDMDSILLSLVMEYYKISMEPTLPITPYCPHLVLHKLNLVSYLIDCGSIVEARAFFDIVTGIVKAAGKSTNYSEEFFTYMDSVAQRLNLNQDDTSSSWIGSKLGRPNLDKVLGHLDKSFSKFVTGDDSSTAKSSLEQDGIFKRLADTPIASRAQSTVDLAGLAKQPDMSMRASSYSGNPYGPPGQDSLPQGLNYSPKSMLPSQTSFGHSSDVNNFSPPQPIGSQAPRPYSPSYGISRRSSEAAPPFDMAPRPKSSSTTRSRGSSVTNQDSHYPSSQAGTIEPYGTPNSSRPYPTQKESHEYVQSGYAGPSITPLKNSVSATPPAANPYAPTPVGVPAASNPYARPATVASSNPYGPASTPSSNPYAPTSASTSPYIRSDTSVNSSSSALHHEPAIPSEQPIALSRTNSFNPDEPEVSSQGGRQSVSSHHQTDTSESAGSDGVVGHNPYTHPATQNNVSSYNPYAPSPGSSSPNVATKYSPAPATSGPSDYKNSDSSAPSVPSVSTPSYGGYNPYGSIYGYDAGEPDNASSGEPSSIPEKDNEDLPNDNQGESSFAPYEPPQYGYSYGDDPSDANEANTNEHDVESSGEVFAPMAAPSFVPTSYTAPPMSNAPSAQSPIAEEEEEEIEDLGFANNSMQKKEEENGKEDDKGKEKQKPKKSGWFSWMRKGNDNDNQVKATQIKFGEEMALVYDPVLRRYINKNTPKEELEVLHTPLPPPPAGPSIKPSTGAPYTSSGSAPPMGDVNLPPSRSGSAQPPSSGPLSAPTSTRSTPIPISGGLDDLLAAAPAPGVARKGPRRNARSRYVDIMSQQQGQEMK